MNSEGCSYIFITHIHTHKHLYIYVYKTIIMMKEKEAMNLRRSRGGRLEVNDAYNTHKQNYPKINLK